MKPLILITNDDGVFSPGLIAAAEAVEDIGELLIVAPRYQQTSMGRSFPRYDNVGIIEEVEINVNGHNSVAYGVHGSPAQAVAHGVLELANRNIDLCISGINYGQNLGLSITCSGTVGAALEANSYGILSIAVSREVELEYQHNSEYINMDWEVSKHITRVVANEVLRNGLPNEISILNINVPNEANMDSEIRITKQSRSSFSTFIKPEKRDFRNSFLLKSKIDVDIEKEDKESDVYAFYVDKVISITPLTWNMCANLDWKNKSFIKSLR